MEGPSTSCAQNKLLLPEQELDDEAATTVTSRRVDNGETVEERMLLNVDPDYDDDSEYFEEGSDSPALTHRGVLDSAAIERRPGERQDTGGVKMSIGNDCDMDEEEEETDEDQRRLFVEGIKKIARKPHESFDLEEQPDSEALRQFFNQQVNNAMMFNQDNHIEYEPIIKRKVPKVIEGYMWGGVIGLGSYGKVKEVIDTYSLTRRAVKIMKYDKLRKITNGWENIRSEMSILRRLNHPNIIKLVEIFNIPSKGKVYMIFEYCIGSVQQLLDLEPAHRLSVGESHAIFIELCEGLNYLHSKRVSHKDIKPGNLLISIDFTVKICDFGVAEQIHLFQKDGRCTKVNGTPKFQPPECVYGNHEFFDGYKADMWSAGVTLYNLVSGRYPFERPILLKLYECIGTEPVEMPSNVKLTNDLEDLLCKLLEKDFNVRPTCLETMLHPWFISSFPEDQGLGRIMERMRTGDRPLTVLPSLAVLYDGAEEQVEIDVDVTPDPPVLVLPGELDRSSFPGFKFIEATLGDGLIADGEESSSGDRRSSRSMPTSAPPGQQNPVLHQGSPSSSPVPPVAAQNAPPCEAVESGPEAAERRPKRRGKRNFLSCIFRSRSDSA